MTQLPTHRIGILGVVVVLGLGANAFTAESQTPLSERYGIGVTLVRADNTSPTVVAGCMPRGPASKAGILPDDTLLTVDGVPDSGRSLNEVQQQLLSDAPGPVNLTIARGTNRLSFRVERESYAAIARGADLKLVPSLQDSTMEQFVPLDEATPLELGDRVEPIVLLNTQCEEATVNIAGGTPTFVFFWAEWCGPCKTLINDLRRLVAQNQIPGVRLVSVSLDKDCATFVAAADSLEIPGERYWGHGWGSEVSQLFRTYQRGIPTGAMISPAGEVTGMDSGSKALFEMVRSANPETGQ